MLIKYYVFQLKEGWIGLAGTSEFLFRITLPQESREQAEKIIRKDLNKAEYNESRFRDEVAQLAEYFAGRRYSFSIALDFKNAPRFARSVWEAVRTIPYGKTRTYAEIACMIGNPRSFRAVGQALKSNPLPIVVPCHRVIASDGGLGGFAGGYEMKKRLLALEEKHRSDI